MQSCKIHNILKGLKEDGNRLLPLYETQNISGLPLDPIDCYSHEETLIESRSMDVILLSIEWVQKQFTLLLMH